MEPGSFWRKIKIGRAPVAVVALLVLSVTGVIGFYFYSQYEIVAGFVPLEFNEARKEGAIVAERIVFLANQSLAGLEQIGGLDSSQRYQKALDLTTGELERNSKARQEAILLSSHLGTMATYLYQIEPNRARTLATEAVGYEVNLVNRLILLNDLLNQLFSLLEDKFRIQAAGRGGGVIEGQVKQLLDSINNEIKVINDLNRQFNSIMEQFDKSVY